MIGSDRPVVLMRDFAGRILDVSPSGCLLESRRRLDVGTVGRLQVTIGIDVCADDVEVVRCEPIAGARAAYRVGLRFLWTTPRGPGSIRHLAASLAERDEASQTPWLM